MPKGWTGPVADTVSPRAAAEAEVRASVRLLERLLPWHENTHVATPCRMPFSLYDAGQGAEREYGNGGSRARRWEG